MVGLAAAIAFSLAGYVIGRNLVKRFSSTSSGTGLLSNGELALLGLYIATLMAFALSNWHFGVYAPVDMLPRGINEAYEHANLLSGAPSPVYYLGAYNTASYFHTSRLEVTIDMGSVDKPADKNQQGLLVAGMGAQSPNCCKDGLDYGYRADIVVAPDGVRYLVARAWETCDQNAACSAFPWQATMYETETAFELGNHTKVSLAMYWSTDGGKKVHWDYRFDNSTSWQEYSVFFTPEIENPAFNVGVIAVNNLATNFPSSNANFFQVGLATPNPRTYYSGITFECPAYFEGGMMHCFPDIAPVKDGDSHWKVFWQWGLPGKSAAIAINNIAHTVMIGS